MHAHKMTYLAPPKLLPWLAVKAGISEPTAHELWKNAQIHARSEAVGDHADFYARSMNRFTELVAAESLRQRAPRSPLRDSLRLHKRLTNALLDSYERIHLATQRSLMAR